MLDEIRAKLDALTAALVGGLSLVAILARYRAKLIGSLSVLGNRLQRGKRIDDSIARISNQIERIHYQLHSNAGNSLKDDVAAMHHDVCFLLEAHNLSYRALPYPAFVCNSAGENTAISTAYQELLGLANQSDLAKLAWQGFLHPEDVQAYSQAFRQASQSMSHFRYPVRFQRSSAEPLGQWLVIASRMRDGSYMGRLWPDDATAVKICDAHSWKY